MAVERLAVIGAGLMGRGIAQVAALGGFKVSLQDISLEYLDKALEVIRSDLEKGLKIGKVSQSQLDGALQNLNLTTDLGAAVGEADLVIEAIPEDLELKLNLFRQLDELCPGHTVLATNTSAKSITEIAAATRRPDKVVGMHFFNPPHKMKLVEIIRGLETSGETFAEAGQAARAMGKETVEANEFPGFITSRINVLIGNEAFYLLMEGVAKAEDIDRALKLGLNHPMGPFELVDLVGLDTRLKVLEYMHQSLGEKYRPCPLLVKYVKAGRLGRKTGKGVYNYTGRE